MPGITQEMYLEITSAKTGKPIGGDSLTKGNENLIQVKKFTIGMSSPEDYSTKQASGKVNIDDVEFEFAQGAVSATLVSMLTSNEQISLAKLQVFKAAGTGNKRLYLEWRFKNARLTSYKQSNEAEMVNDTIRIGYVSFDVDSSGQKGDGTMTGMKSSSYDGNKGDK